MEDYLRIAKRHQIVRGNPVTWEYVDFPDAVAILAVDADGRFLVVEQYRAPVDSLTLEVPAGTLETGEDPRTAAERELREETGFSARRWHEFGSFYPAIGYSTERITLFQASDLVEGSQELDASEEIVVHHFTPGEFARAIEEGRIRDSKSMLAYLLWKHSV